MNRDTIFDELRTLLIYSLHMASRNMPGIHVQPSSICDAVDSFLQKQGNSFTDEDLAGFRKDANSLYKAFALFAESHFKVESTDHYTMH